LDFCEDFPLAGFVFVKQGESGATSTTTGGATDAMGVGARGAGEIDVDDEIDGLEVDASVNAIF